MNGPAVGQADDPQEQWNRVHAQLLKSVADAQARLLAAQNETNDRLEGLAERLTTLTVSAAALNANHAGLKVLIAQTQETVRTCHGNISGRLDGVNRGLDELTDLARPTLTRRQVEKLHPKRIVKRAVDRKR